MKSLLSKMGFPVYLKKKLLDLTLQEHYEQILENLWKYGVICLKNIDINPKEFIQFTNRTGSILRLPPELSFNNLHKEYPEIARVGNVKNDGSIMKGVTYAEYWHSDGDFWPTNKNFIINFLYTQIIPKQGGKTAFLNLNHVLKTNKHLENKFTNAKILTNFYDIKDFSTINIEEFGIEKQSVHPALFVHPFKNEKVLYLGGNISKIVFENETVEYSNDYIEKFSNEEEIYEHEWEEGDILIWDNTQILHRAMGNYEDNPRLLFRLQTMITPFDKDIINCVRRSLNLN